MNRREFGAAAAALLATATRRPASAQTSLDIVPDLIKVRASAENDIRQVHLLAKLSAGTASPVPVDLVTIDGQYDDLAAAVNGYLEGLAAAIQLPRPLDDKKWKAEGDTVVDQAQKFDNLLQGVKTAAGASVTPTRGGAFFTTLTQVLTQIVLPGSTLFQNTKKQVDSAGTDAKKAAADVLQSARWRDAATVLGTAPSPEPRRPAPSAAPS